MRSFVITRPGLSVGPVGIIVTADELVMNDDQLDAFVEAGYAVEVHEHPRAPVAAAPAPATPPAVAEPQPVDEAGDLIPTPAEAQAVPTHGSPHPMFLRDA